MPIGRKFDYPPLLAPGRHYFSLAQVKERFVDPFPDHIGRQGTFHRLESFVQQVLVADFPCDVWLDGSFLTEKPDPSDLDVTVIIDSDVSQTLTADQSALVEAIANAQIGDGIDSFAFVRLPRDHPNFGDELADPAHTWGEQYGLENSDEWLKGFVILRLRETGVGLRIRS